MGGLQETADIVVVGGGVVGTACTFHLAARGHQVLLIEQAGIAAGSSSATQSLVGYGMGGDRQHLELQIAAMAAYDDLVSRGHDIGFTRNGAIVVPDGPADQQALRDAVLDRQASGLEPIWATEEELRELEPNIDPPTGGAAYLPELGQVSPMRLAVELARAARAHGATVSCGTSLDAIELDPHGGFVAVRTSQGRVAARSLVIAAGARTRAVGMLAGLNVPIWPRKGHVLVTEPARGFLGRPVVDFRYGASAGPGTAPPEGDGPPVGPADIFAVVQPLPSGQLLVGGSRQFAGFERKTDRDVVRRIAARAVRMLPELGTLRVIRSYTGFRPWTPDGRPLIGPLLQAKGVHLAAGHGGEGVTESVVTGRIVADLMSGTEPPVDVAPLAPDRFPLHAPALRRSST